MPLIRYKTEDLAVVTNRKCSCGSGLPLIAEIHGRLQDLILTKNSTLVSLTALIFAQHFEAFNKIINLQLEQQRKGELIVRVVKDRTYGLKEEKEIQTKLLMAVSGGLELCFEYVNAIPQTKSGKHKFLIQKIPGLLEGQNLIT